MRVLPQKIFAISTLVTYFKLIYFNISWIYTQHEL